MLQAQNVEQNYKEAFRQHAMIHIVTVHLRQICLTKATKV